MALQTAVCGDMNNRGTLIPYKSIDRNTVKTIYDGGVRDVVVPQANLDMFLQAYEDAKATWEDMNVEVSFHPALTIFDALPLVFLQAAGITFPVASPPTLPVLATIPLYFISRKRLCKPSWEVFGVPAARSLSGSSRGPVERGCQCVAALVYIAKSLSLVVPKPVPLLFMYLGRGPFFCGFDYKRRFG